MLKKHLLPLLFLFPLIPQAQNAIEPYLGLGIDVADAKPLTQFNIGLQYPVINKPVFQMLIGVRGGLPINKYTGADVAYTADPSLPLQVTTGYQAQWYSFAFAIGNRFKVVSWADKNAFSFFVNAGYIIEFKRRKQ